MLNREFKYDAAFSISSKDEQLALQIADRIRDRVNVFVYSEKQEVFAGTDGVNQHMCIYEEEARVVVVLYRDGWGHTEWTRVEETAIKNRGFKEGYDFLVFVPLDNSEKPKWLPKTRIWVGFDRFGIDGIASAVEASIQAEGGAVRSESVGDYAARIARELNFHSERRSFLSSEKGVESAKNEVNIFFNELQRLTEEINRQSDQIQIVFDRSTFDFGGVSAGEIRFGVTWRLQWGNTLEGAGLTFILTEGGAFRGGYIIRPPEREERVLYDVDLDLSEKVGWRESQGKKLFFTSSQLAEFWLKHLLNRIHRRVNG